MDISKLIDELAELCGIIPEYYDIWGNLRSVSLKTKKSVLKEMGYPVDDGDALGACIEELKNSRYLRLVEPVRVIPVKSEEMCFSLFVPTDDVDEESASLRWSIMDEEGHNTVNTGTLSELPVTATHEINGRRIREFSVSLGDGLMEGYYDISVEVSSGAQIKGRMRLIITPERCYLPPQLKSGWKTWGLYINLYSVRSRRNQGVGDLTDLSDIIKWVGTGLGGGFVGINPLHSLSNKQPFGISPYSPLSRLYSNLIYIDTGKVRDVLYSERAMAIVRSPGYKKEISDIKEAGLIDYTTVYILKRMVLETGFQHFYDEHYLKNTRRAKRLLRYITTEGKPLEDYATFMALYEYFSKKGLYHWKDWPEGYRRPDSEGVVEFRKANFLSLLFHKYTQWLIHEQVEKAVREAEKAGMSVGLYRDLAVGSLSCGSDVWGNQHVYAEGMDVGAPPDDFSLSGQNWGFPPLIPARLREEGYEFFIQLIRKNLRYGGALRIDHALGLFRLFWIPCGMKPEDGVYIRYPYQDLLGIIALESVRNKAVIIAEDLGTIGEEVREALHRYGMLSFRLFYFERNYSVNEFLPPEAYPEMAIVSTTTHDLPTLKGFWTGRDIEMKRMLDLYPDEGAYRREIVNRANDRLKILSALERAGVLPEVALPGSEGIPDMDEALIISIYRYLGKTPSKLLIVNLDDVLGTPDQQNLPGTIDEHPNWRQKTPYALEDIMWMGIFTHLRDVRDHKY